MPEFIRALIAILVIGSVVLYLVKPLFVEFGMPVAAFDARRKYWYLVTAAAFLSLNFWVFVVVLVGILLHAKKRETGVISLYFFLIMALPLLKAELPGFVPIRFLFEVDYLRVLVMVLLLPVCMRQWQKKDSKGRSANRLIWCDSLLLGYILLTVILRFREDDVIGVARYIMYSIADVGIPYYAISRSVSKIEDFREVLSSFAMTGLVVSAIAVFEFTRRWLLYSSLGDALGLDMMAGYLDRGNFLRALVTSGQPIVLGYDLIAVLGAVLYLKSEKTTVWRYWSAVALVIFGSIATLSKGPWVGMVLTAAVLILTDKKSGQKIVYALLVVACVAIFMANTDFGAAAVEYLPFVGKLDEGSMSYRQLLFDKSIQAISDNPVFGSINYLDKMEDLRQGQGIIDLVNTYLMVALDSGLVGLALFAGYFIAMFASVYTSIKEYPKGSNEEFLGRILVAILIGLLFVLSACSPIENIPALYIGFSALALSYHRMTGKLKL